MPMSRCERCGKGVQYGHNVSHAKNRTNRVFKPNLHTLRVVVNGVRKKMTLCSSCVRMVRRGSKMSEVNKGSEVTEVIKKNKESEVKKERGIEAEVVAASA